LFIKIGVIRGYRFVSIPDKEERVMIISLVKITPPPAKKQDVLDLMNYILGPTRVIPGCLDCSIYEGGADGSILFIEKWQSRVELNEHIKSNSYMSILTAMELSTSPPEILISESTESDGMELIKELRSG
jgi:quinol monooxygenase YgiN